MAQGTPLHELFVDELNDLCNAEHHLVGALPRMARVAATRELKGASENHPGETGRPARRPGQIGTEALHV
jgi:ferritin-like metal-binding protein YciE